MLKSETDTLLQIARGLAPAHISISPPKPGSFEQQVQLIEQECEKIRHVWAALLKSPVKDEVLKRFIPYQQRLISEQSDLVQGWLSAETAFGFEPALLKSYRNCLLTLLAGLTELTDYLFDYFPGYFNIGAQLPVPALLKAMMHITETKKALTIALEQTTVEPLLLTSIFAYLKDTEEVEPQEPVTYRSLAFFNSFTNLIKFIAVHPNDRNITERLCEAMLYINFNYPAFFSWYQLHLRESNNSPVNSEEKLLWLVDQLILVKTIPVLASSGYEPGLPHITVLIENWLNVQIARNQEKAGERWQRLQLTVTVPQLGLLARLLYDEGFFTLTNISEILRFLSGCFSSKMQGHISAESMRKSFYGKDPFAAASIKNLLTGMLEKVNRIINPGN